jgi:acyl dehydratase
MTEGLATLENRTFDEIAIGNSASVTKTLTGGNIALFAAVSGGVNPIHLDERLAEASRLRRVVGHGRWGGGLISGLLGTSPAPPDGATHSSAASTTRKHPGCRPSSLRQFTTTQRPSARQESCNE